MRLRNYWLIKTTTEISKKKKKITNHFHRSNIAAEAKKTEILYSKYKLIFFLAFAYEKKKKHLSVIEHILIFLSK